MPVIEPGDRLPNFLRRTTDGHKWIFYDECCGRPSFTLFVGLEDAQASVSALARAAIPETIARIVVVTGDESAVAGIAGSAGEGLIVIADDGSLLIHMAGGTSGVIVAADANQRVLSAIPVAGGNDIDSAVSTLVRGLPAPDPESHTISSQAPVLVLPRVLDADFCTRLIAAFDATGGEPSGVLKRRGERMEWTLDPDTKDRREFRIEAQPLLGELSDTIGRRVLPEIRKAFQYQVTRFEVMKLVRYDADTGGYFRAHRDNVGPDTLHRRFAMTVNLNTPEYEGGELLFPEYGNQRYRPDAGAAMVFSCSLAHEVMRVRAGKRYALLSFFFNDDPGDGQTAAPV